MSLVINDEQAMLKTSAREFLKDRAPVAALRKLRDERDETGFDRDLWSEMAEMGWAGLTIPETWGGLGFGYTGLGQVLEEMGRTLAASPMVSTVLLGASTVMAAANDAQKNTLLPGIASGELILALAAEEQSRHAPFHVETTATNAHGDYRLNGKKTFVLDGHVADYFIVLARTSGSPDSPDGLSFFLVNAEEEGIERERTIMMDSRNAAVVRFRDVRVAESALIGSEGKAGPVWEKVLDIARIGLSAEMLGTGLEAFERTINYLKERRQFGVPIGSFQGLQHRAAQMFCELELCKSLVIHALQAIDQGKDLPVIASRTKAKLSETLRLVTNEGVQMFGGIGMTDDEEIGFFLKRARVAQQTFGDAAYHLDRYARLRGF
ncbi:MAG: acyl-CoA dehydrogenase [Bacteroidetes bacterium]|nr:MAG: acyl-CoA dehydrogenase [Bacteroidota bacterium]